jgi:polyhydroxyalkanoate synthesis regulator phasin
MSISEELRKVLLAGIGAVATTAEKSKDLVDALVAKGELTVEQGKVLNEELKRNVSESIQQAKEKKAASSQNKVLEQMDQMTPEQLQQVKEKLEKLENQ